MSQILLLEPDYILACTYKSALINAGHNVLATASAQSAVAAADKLTPDVVILELQLIEHSGIEFLYEFRSYPEWQNIPVIVQTQVPPVEFAGSWELLKRELGVVSYLYKTHTSLKNLLSSVSELSLAQA